MKERIEYLSPEVFKTSLMGEPVAVLCGPDWNKFLFTNENNLVTIWWPTSVRKLLEHWETNEKMLSCFIIPDAFTRFYIKTMNAVAQQHIDTWQGKEEVKVFPTIKLYMTEVACRFFTSLEGPHQIAKLDVLFNVFLKGIISAPVNFPGTRIFNEKRATIAIKKQVQTIFRNRRVTLERDLLSDLLAHPDENGKLMSESVIFNNILMLFFAGHDTSSVAITMLMKNLGQLP